MASNIKTNFGQLPSSADRHAVQPFNIHLPSQDLERMNALIKLSRVADVSYENTLPDGGSRLGLRREWLAQAKWSWENEFDW